MHGLAKRNHTLAQKDYRALIIAIVCALNGKYSPKFGRPNSLALDILFRKTSEVVFKSSEGKSIILIFKFSFLFLSL